MDLTTVDIAIDALCRIRVRAEWAELREDREYTGPASEDVQRAIDQLCAERTRLQEAGLREALADLNKL